MKELDKMRRITLEGAHNVRDIGGYKTKDGRLTKWKKFIRADGLENLSRSDVTKLLDYGLNIDIDLRSEAEYKTWIDVLEQCDEIEYYQVQLLKNLRITSSSLGGIYVNTADSCMDKFYKVFKIMADNPEKTILFHCSAGKDRTGMTAALLLMLAGVDKEDIIADYTITTENLYSIIDKFSGENDENLKDYLGSKREYIEKFINHIQKKYDGAESYMKKIGLKESEIEILKESFLENGD
jgi:protein-tyrosine phosphatase